MKLFKTVFAIAAVGAGVVGLRLTTANAANRALSTPQNASSNAPVQQIAAPRAAPELVGNSSLWLNTDGKDISLQGRHGQVTMVEFWTFACSNCQANLPAYARLYKAFSPYGVTMLGIHTPETEEERNPQNVAREVKKLNIQYPVLLDAKGQNWNRWQQHYWPTIYVLDRNGVPRFKWEGEFGKTGELKIAQVVQGLLKEPSRVQTRTSAKQAPKAAPAKASSTRFPPDSSTKPYVLTDAQWRKVLTPQQYYVLRQKGTDAPFTGSYERTTNGIYRCTACHNILFSDATQFDSGTGWPSFWKPLRAQGVHVGKDADGERDEVTCARCGSHLGHLFNDGPKPTGLRYCMDQSALTFQPTKK